MKRKSKSEEDRERFERQAAMPVVALFPRTHFRLTRLLDGDDSLTGLLNLFEGQGMPMGSEQWPAHCAAFLQRLIAERSILHRLIETKEKPDWQRAIDDLDHARKMHNKRKPSEGLYECHYCGHHDAKPITTEIAACPSCAKELPL